MTDVVNLASKLELFSDHWSPKIVAEMNGLDVMVVKVEGEFRWHAHADFDDVFLVISGELEIDLPDQTVTLNAGELFVVPRGMAHRPAARKGEVQMLLIEPHGAPNTGDLATAAIKRSI